MFSSHNIYENFIQSSAACWAGNAAKSAVMMQPCSSTVCHVTNMSLLSYRVSGETRASRAIQGYQASVDLKALRWLQDYLFIYSCFDVKINRSSQIRAAVGNNSFYFDFQGPPGPIGPEGKQVRLSKRELMTYHLYIHTNIYLSVVFCRVCRAELVIAVSKERRWAALGV